MTVSKWIVLLVITAVIAWGGVALADNVNQTHVYTGTDVKFTIDPKQYMLIDADTANLEAASSEFFAMRKITGETVVATPQNPPLSWTKDTYFAAGPVAISGGRWIIAVGTPIVELTSDKPLTIHVSPTDDQISSNRLGAAYVGFLVWVVALVILGACGFYRDG